jgi:hypothetical protein
MPATEVPGMLIRTGWSVSRLVPFTVTPVKLTEPKSVSGRTLEPPEVFEGASAMASAEDRSAPVWVVLIVCVQPCVVSSSTSRNLSLPGEMTMPVNLSPGLTGFAKFTPAPG